MPIGGSARAVRCAVILILKAGRRDAGLAGERVLDRGVPMPAGAAGQFRSLVAVWRVLLAAAVIFLVSGPFVPGWGRTWRRRLRGSRRRRLSRRVSAIRRFSAGAESSGPRAGYETRVHCPETGEFSRSRAFRRLPSGGFPAEMPVSALRVRAVGAYPFTCAAAGLASERARSGRGCVNASISTILT